MARRHLENETSSFVWHGSGSQDVKAVDSALYYKINIVCLCRQFYRIRHHVLLMYLEKTLFALQ